MSKINDGCPAFPRTSSIGEPNDGMSLRDYFAAQALAGMLAAHSGEGVAFPAAGVAAMSAYDYADAMLKAREAK